MAFEWFGYVSSVGDLIGLIREKPEIADLAKDILSRVLFYNNKE